MVLPHNITNISHMRLVAPASLTHTHAHALTDVSQLNCDVHLPRPDLITLRTLDSSIKRNTAVIKKLRQLSEDQRELILEELKSLNLLKYVSEAVAAICEAKLKAADIPAAVQVKLVDLYHPAAPWLLKLSS